ncbi:MULTISPECIES: metallophosphoesterase family protein [Bacillus]|uniref:metallophosphoesterase family protein n=1 Tax=Bacillus TaxID=1386 RepID=UPI000BB99AFB|nr:MULTISPECIES: metallophosphoesterase [Bacillus]
MKVLIISDNHGDEELLKEIAKRHSPEVNALFHCGDSELAANSEAMKHYESVRGNCDYDSNYPQELTKDVNGVRFYITHGHLHQVKSTLMPIKYRAEEVGARVVCFGHSHIAGTEMVDGILFINPGSILLPRMTKDQSYVILEYSDNDFSVLYYNEIGHLLKSFSFKN